MAVPALPSDDSDANDWNASKVNVIYDHLQWWRDTRPVFKGEMWSDVGAGFDIDTSTTTTFGVGEAASFKTTPVLNIGSWTTQGSDADPESLVVPEAGVYRIGFACRWQSNATGYRQTRLLIDGSTQTESAHTIDTLPAAAVHVTRGTDIYDLAAGAQLDLTLFHNQGGTLTMQEVFITCQWIQST